MSLFQFNKSEIIVTKEIGSIKAFKYVLEHPNVNMFVSYIYHLCDYQSPYAIYSQDIRKSKVEADILGSKLADKDEKILNDAIDMYKKLTTTDSLLLIESARRAVRKLQDYFDNIDLSASDDPGKDAKNLVSALQSVGKLIGNLDEWEEIIKKERSSDKTRKNVNLNKYNS